MAEYYNHWNSHYSWLLNQPVVSQRFKIELLDHNEQAHGEITRDVSSDDHFTININKSQGVRRTCSLTVINVEKKYIPTVNNPFWYNKKFKLYVGIVDAVKNDTYWFAQGVFICQSASANRATVNISGIDKFGFLDGSLNVHMLFAGYTIEAGVAVGEVIRQTLALEMGNGSGVNTGEGRAIVHSQCIDTAVPIIDEEFENVTLPKDIVLSEGQYLGDALTDIASSFGADLYYDVDGRLNMKRILNDDIPFYYIYSGEYWHFEEIHETYIEPSANYSFDGCNYVVVSTDNNDEGEVSTYTAINDNPQSPISISAVGYRGDKDNPITYIPAVETLPPEIPEWDGTIPDPPTFSYKDMVIKYVGETTTPVVQGKWIKDNYYICRGRGYNNYSWRLLGETLESLNSEIVEHNTEYCRQHAEYLLLQKTCPTVAMTFKTQTMPHLDVGVIVTVTDSQFGYENEPFLVESLTFDGLNGMDISIVNIQWLPNLADNTTGISVSNSSGIQTYTLTYDVGEFPVDAPSAETGVANDTICVPDMPRSITVGEDTYHFAGWDDSNYITYIPKPMRDANPTTYENFPYAYNLQSNATLTVNYIIDT